MDVVVFVVVVLVCGLWAVGCGLWAVGCGLSWVEDFQSERKVWVLTCAGMTLRVRRAQGLGWASVGLQARHEEHEEHASRLKTRLGDLEGLGFLGLLNWAGGLHYSSIAVSGQML
jgi:hypothetical protein